MAVLVLALSLIWVEGAVAGSTRLSRHASRTVERFFGPQLQEAESTTLEPATIETLLSSHAAVVEPRDSISPFQPGSPSLVESTIPLGVMEAGEGLQPVDLGLEDRGEGFGPRRPLVDVELPERLDEEIWLPEQEIGIEFPQGAANQAPSQIGDSALVYPAVAKDSSLLALPTATGLETMSLLESSAAPLSQIYILNLPAGASLRETYDGGAEVVRGGEVVLSVFPPTAIDALGESVSAQMRVSGSSLIVTAEAETDTQFPVLVDPIYQTYSWAGGSTTGLSAWTSTSNTSLYTPSQQISCGTNCVAGETANTPGLYVGANTGSVTAGASAYWSYFVPRYQSDKSTYGTLPTSFVSSVEFNNVKFFHRSDSAMSPALFAGLWASSSAPVWGGPNNWVSQVIHYGNQGDWTNETVNLANPSNNQSAKWVMAGIAATESKALASYRDAYFGGSKIGLSDTGKPVLSGATSPTEWVDEFAPIIPLTAEDTGLGVYSFTSSEVSNPSQTWQYSLSCSGTVSSPCPRVWHSSEGSPALTFWPSALAEGIDKVAVTGSDPVGNVSEPQYVTVKVDHSPPVVKLSGTLTDPGPKRVDPGKYGLHVDAVDGSESSPRSGVKSIAIEVDGTVAPGTVEQSCPGGSCPATRDWTFDVNSYSNGEHVVKVKVKDQLGHQSTSELKVTVDKGRLYWGARMDGEVYSPTWGDAPWDSQTWSTFQADAGKKVSIVHFGQPPPWEQKFASTPLEKAYAGEAIPLMSMGSGETSLEALASGKGSQVEAFREWAHDVRLYEKPFFFRFDWEMNLKPNKNLAWTEQVAPNPKSFVDAWKELHLVAEEEGASNITWVWCPNVSYEGSTPLAQLWPGSAYVDWTCLDGYNHGTQALNPEGWKTFSQVFKQTYNEVLSLAPSKPIMIGETASTEDGGSKAEWISQALGKEIPVEFPKIKALVWFNWNIQPKEGNPERWKWPIESSESARGAFATAIASPNYAPGEESFKTPPLLAPIQPLP